MYISHVSAGYFVFIGASRSSFSPFNKRVDIVYPPNNRLHYAVDYFNQVEHKRVNDINVCRTIIGCSDKLIIRIFCIHKICILK